MNKEIRKIIDELYRASNEAGTTLEEIQAEIAKTFKLRAKMDNEEIHDESTTILNPKKKGEDLEFEKKVKEFVDMLTYEGNERTQNLCRQRTIDAICIFHKMRMKFPNLTAQMLIEICCKKWKCSVNVATKQISRDKQRFCKWNSSNQNPLDVDWLFADGRSECGKTEYVLQVIEKYISNISV